jgi:hypothetical protein
MAGPLNLADATEQNFDAIDAGRVRARVHEVSMDAVKNENGKLPKGTPGVKFQFAALDENPEYDDAIGNRRFFNTYWIPPKDYDKQKAGTLKGMLLSTLKALGENEDEVRSKDYDPDWEDFKGRECILVISKEPVKRDGVEVEGEWQNRVKSVKPIDSGTGGGDVL